MSNIILTPSKTLILPEEIPVKEAIRLGLANPPRRVKGKTIPATPVGGGIFAKYAVQVLDKAGKAVPFRHPKTGKMVRKIEGPSHSFTRNLGLYILAMYQNFDSALNQNPTLTDDTGASFVARMISAGLTGNFSMFTGVPKIKFGNSSAALSTTQFNLQGVLLGPTTEAATTPALVVEDTVQTIFTVTGQITNGSGGSFTVQEMGLFPEMNDSAGTANKTTMFLRDLTGAIVVNNGQTIIGTYTFTIAV